MVRRLDALELRQRIVNKFHDFILDGGSLAIAARFHRQVKLLATLAGVPVDEVIADLRADALSVMEA